MRLSTCETKHMAFFNLQDETEAARTAEETNLDGPNIGEKVNLEREREKISDGGRKRERVIDRQMHR